MIPGAAVSKTVITNLESGRKRDLTVTELLLIAEALDVPPLFLVVDPRRPWDKLDVPGIDRTNIEFARRSDLFADSMDTHYGFDDREGAFWGGPKIIERALVRGEQALEDLKDVPAMLEQASASGVDALTGARREDLPAETRRLLIDPTWAYQRPVTELASALEILGRYAPQADSDHVQRRYERLQQNMERIQAEMPQLDFRPHVFPRTPLVPSTSEGNDGSPQNPFK